MSFAVVKLIKPMARNNGIENEIFERQAMNMYLHHGMSVYFGEALEKIGDNLRERGKIKSRRIIFDPAAFEF